MHGLQPRCKQRHIAIVDSDKAVRDALSVLFSLEGFTSLAFGDGASFLDAARQTQLACVILDTHMPDRSGIDLLKAINARHFPAPIFMISGRGDIATAVDAIKNGAHDFLQKPFAAHTLLERVRNALATKGPRAVGPGWDCTNFPGSALLTPRERDVLTLIAGGASNKEAGRSLGISPRTIEVHRARIMDKLGAKNAADLVRIVMSEPGSAPAPAIDMIAPDTR